MNNINVGSQQAGQINNVVGNQINYGGQSAEFTAGTVDVRGLVGDLRAAVEQAQLPPAVAADVRGELDELDMETARPEPDREVVKSRLSRITELLRSAGALVAAGTGLLGPPLGALTRWLGG